MKNIARIFFVTYLLAAPCIDQNWATVTASNVTDLNQNKLAAGQLCFLVTDQNDNPISVSVGGGGQTLKRPYCTTVTAGAASAFTVPNPAATSPSGIYYRVTVKDTSTGLEVLRYTQVTFTGGAFNFDAYAPANLGSFSQLTGNSVAGNLNVSGNESVTGASTAASYSATGAVTAGAVSTGGTVTAGAFTTSGGSTAGSFTTTGAATSAAFNASTRGDRQIILQNPDFEGSTVLPPPGWVTSGGVTVSYETSSPAPGKSQSIKLATTLLFAGIHPATTASVVPGDVFTWSAIAKSDGTGLAQANFQFQDKNGADVGDCANPSVTSTTWTPITGGPCVAPANAIKVAFFVGNSTSTPSAVWFDQFVVRKIDFPALAIGGHLNQTSSGKFAGTCAMSSSTTCAIAIASSYASAPGCVATVQGTTAIAGACLVSGTTVTVTAASSNSQTWAAMLFGNPN